MQRKKQLLNQITNSLKYSNQFPILLQQKRVKHNIQNVNFFLFLPTSGLSRSNTRTKIRKRNKSRREIKYVHLISFPIILRHDFVLTETTLTQKPITVLVSCQTLQFKSYLQSNSINQVIIQNTNIASSIQKSSSYSTHQN